jgi:aspartyl-tRNA(Asn)/glutamyl-tRNA(Gln) amidotransferase subunit A
MNVRKSEYKGRDVSWHEDRIAAWKSTGTVSGPSVVPVDLSDYARMHEDVTVIMIGELASTQEANLDRFELFDIGVQVRIARRLVPSATDYLRSLRRRVLAQRAAVQAFDNAGVDHLLTDTTAARLSDVTVEVNEVRHPMQSIVGRNSRTTRTPGSAASSRRESDPGG